MQCTNSIKHQEPQLTKETFVIKNGSKTEIAEIIKGRIRNAQPEEIH